MRDKIRTLFKSKFFIACLSFFVVVPLVALVVVKINLPIRSSGTYNYYENGVLSSTIVLTDNNNVYMYFYDKETVKDDKEYVYRNKALKWTYRVSDWKNNYDPEKYHFLSEEYIRFGLTVNDSNFILFKIGNNLYTDYLLSDARGGGQKCYSKK